MAMTPSSMLPLGTPAPDFDLIEPLTGKHLRLADVRGELATVVMFICNHCPYVKHVNAELIRLANDYRGRGVGFAAICSNDADRYPDDAPPLMAEAARQLGYPFPYLHDDTQQVARAYQAACTPDFFVFDEGCRCAYRGQLDESRPSNGKPVTGAALRAALEALLAGRPVNANQVPSIGCNIKWRS